MLFCGHEFRDGFVFTREALAGDERFVVTSCAREDVAAHVLDADMAVPLMTPVDAPLLAAATRLRYVLQFGVGLEARVARSALQMLLARLPADL